MIPLQVQKFIYHPGRRLYGLVITGISKPGVLATISSLIAERGLDIPYCTSIAVRTGERGGILLIVDFTDSDVEPEELAEELRRLEFVESISLIEPFIDGLLIDDATFPIMLGRKRALILDEEMLRGIFVSFRRHLGSGGAAMLYHLGLEAGRSRGRHAMKMAQRVGVRSLEKALELVAKALKALGYGIVEILEFQEDPSVVVKIRVHRSVECEVGRGVGHPFSQYLRGIIVGIVSEILQREMMAREVKCIAMGDPYCEFELQPKE